MSELCILQAFSTQEMSWSKSLVDDRETLIRAAIRYNQQKIPIPSNLASHLVHGYVNGEVLTGGKLLHSLLVRNGLDSISILADNLIRLFASSGSLNELNYIFSKVLKPSQYTWNAMLDAHAKLNTGKVIFQLFRKMQDEGTTADRYTYPSVLKACGSIERGRHIHEHIVENGSNSDIVMNNTLVNMYAKSGSLEEAHKLFDRLLNRNIVTWGAMISGYAQHGEGHVALGCFADMKQQGIKPDRVIFLSILKACGCLGAVEHGRLIHEQIINSKLHADIVVGSTLIDMYAKCSSLEEACNIFGSLPKPDLVCWGAMIDGYTKNDEEDLAMSSFVKMQQEGIKPSKLVYSSVLKACGNLEQGRHIHEQVIEVGLHNDVVVGSTLLDMYARLGNLHEVSIIVDRLSNRDALLWGAILAAYAQLGEAGLTAWCFEDMRRCGIKSCDMIFNSVLIALARAGMVDEGLWYFKLMVNSYCSQPNVLHITSIIDLLGRSALFKEAKNVLDSTMRADIFLWLSLLSTCRMYGNMEFGRQCFDEIIHLDSQCGAAYYLMTSIYASAIS